MVITMNLRKHTILIFTVAIMLGAAIGFASLSVFAAGPIGSTEAGRYERISAQLLKRGMAALEKGQLEQARAALEQSIVANPHNASAYSYLGYTAQRANDKPLAKKYFSLALEINPDDLRALSWGGQSDLSSANLEAAQAKLQRLSRLCGPGCSEYKLLSDAVTSFRSKPTTN